MMQPLNTFCFDVSRRTLVYGFALTEKYVVAPGSHTVVHSLNCSGCHQNPAHACSNHHAVLETGLVWHAACHPTSSLMLTASRDMPRGKMGLWNLETGTHVRDFSGHEDLVSRVAFLDGGSTFVSAYADGLITLWNSTDQKPTGILRGHTGRVTNLVELGDGLLASNANDGVRIWELGAKSCVRVLEGHAEGPSILSLEPGPDSTRLRTGAQGVVRIWDWKSGELIATRDDADSRSNEQLSQDAEGRLLTYGLAGNIHTWTRDGRARVGAPHAAHDAPVRTAIPLGQRFMVTVGTSDGRVKVWDWAATVAGGAKVWLFDLFNEESCIIRNVTTGFGRLAIASQGYDNGPYCVRVWDLEAVQRLALVHINEEAAASGDA